MLPWRGRPATSTLIARPKKSSSDKVRLPRGFLGSTTAGKPQWSWWWSREGAVVVLWRTTYARAHSYLQRQSLPSFPTGIFEQMWMQLRETCVVQFCNDGGSDAGWDGGEVKEGEGGEHAALLARRWRRPGLPPPPRPAPCRRAGHLHRQVDPQSEACHPAQTTALYSIRIIVQLFQPLSDRIQWEHFLRKKMQLTLIQFWERANCPLCPSLSFPFQPFFPMPSQFHCFTNKTFSYQRHVGS